MNDLQTIARWATALVAAAIGFCGQLAHADSIVVTGVDTSRGEYNVWIGENGSDVNTYFAGVILIQLTDPVGVFNRDTLCVQLFTDIYLYQPYGTNVVTPDSQGGGGLDRVSWLLDNALLPAQTGNAVDTILPSVAWVSTAAQGAGMQLAIWDIVEDGGDGFTKGKVQQGSAAHPTDTSVLDWAQYYETQSLGLSSTDAYVYLNVNVGNGIAAQTLEGPEFPFDGGPQPTPEASTLVLAGTALAGIGLISRRKAGMLGSRSAKP